jgi:Zn-dependent M28 family amino/carboxypeptidase
MDSTRRRLAAFALLIAIGAGCAPGPRSSADGPSHPLPSVRASAGTSPAAPAAGVIDRSAIEADLGALMEIAAANGGARVAGTSGYEASVDHVARRLRDLGFAVETPSVEFTAFDEPEPALLEVEGRSFSGPDELHALIYAPGGDVTGPVSILDGSGCEAADFDGMEAGAIVLTVRGGCFRRDQALNAAAAGAAALLVGYPGRGPGEIFRPTLLDPAGITIPVVSVTDAAIQALEAAAGDEARLVVHTAMRPARFRNVVAQLGAGPSVVMVGAHLDSVLEGPGMNDNGSGVAAALAVAGGVAAAGVPDGWAIRFGFWGGEEFGTIGSRSYAATVGDEVVAYLNLDMAGSVAGATLVYDEAAAVAGSERITAAFEAWLSDRGEAAERIDLGGSSDQYGFIQAGVPTGGLFSGATETGGAAQPSGGSVAERAPDPCYHLACDDLDNVDVDRVVLFAEATLAVALDLTGD